MKYEEEERRRKDANDKRAHIKQVTKLMEDVQRTKGVLEKRTIMLDKKEQVMDHDKNEMRKERLYCDRKIREMECRMVVDGMTSHLEAEAKISEFKQNWDLRMQEKQR